MMLLTTLPTGDPVHRYSKCVIVPFTGKRRVLSTCPLNGGYREDLTAVLNNDGNPGAGMACTLRAPTYEEHMAIIAEEVGMDPQHTSAMSTAASMENVAIVTESYDGVSVSAVVTGGIEVNGGRVGDPASWQEVDGKAQEIKLGTINIMVFFNVDLTPGALTRALVTCTEAKTAAIQELVAPSRYSMGLATGSGTDGTILAADAESPIRLTNAGKHSKFGELIGKAVKQAVKEALSKQSGLNPMRQHQVEKRIDRFGLTEQTLWERYAEKEHTLNRADFSEAFYQLSHRDELVTASALYAHLLDELMWELLSPRETWDMAQKILGIMEKKHRPALQGPEKREDMISFMIDALADTLVSLINV